MEWIGQLFASETFRGASLFTLTASSVALFVNQWLKNVPVLAKQDDDARAALDASTQAELLRLAERLTDAENRVGSAERRHAECETSLDDMRQRFRKLEDDMTGLRRQLVQYEQTSVRLLETRPDAPVAAARAKKQRDEG